MMPISGPLGTALLTMLLVGTLFFWLAEGRTFLQALAYSAATMAMNSPYGIGWGPKTTGGILFNIMYLFSQRWPLPSFCARSR